MLVLLKKSVTTKTSVFIRTFLPWDKGMGCFCVLDWIYVFIDLPKATVLGCSRNGITIAIADVAAECGKMHVIAYCRQSDIDNGNPTTTLKL